MNRIIYTLFSLFALILIQLMPLKDIEAQQPSANLRSSEYKAAIENIVAQSNGSISNEEVILSLSDFENQNSPPPSNSVLLSEIFFLFPTVELVSFDGSEAAEFGFYLFFPVAVDTSLFIDWTGIPDWVDTLSAVISYPDSSITINVLPNSEPIARSATITAKVILFGDTLSSTAFILQAPAPQPYIFVSPNFLTVSPEGGATPPFSVIHFNLDSGWEAMIANDWIEVDSSSLTPNSISFNIAANTSGNFRSAVIEIRAVDNPELKDTITLFQYAGAENYLIVSPTNINIGPGGGFVEVLVQTNLSSWNAEITENPGGMIAGLVQNPTNDTLLIAINPNMTANPRVGHITISGGDPLLSQTIQVYQSAAYLLLNPAEVVVPCSGDDVAVEVVSFGVDEIQVVETPSWVSVNILDSNNLLISIAENTTASVRTGFVVIGSTSNPLIVDSLEILQYSCSQAYIFISPGQQLANWNDTVLASPFIISSNNTGTLSVTSSASWLETQISGDSVFATIEVNISGITRVAEITVFDSSDPLVSAQATVVQGGAQSLIYVSPGFQSVSHTGGITSPFEVFTLNIAEWEVFFENTPTWITNIQTTGNTIFFTLAANNSPVLRQVTFRVRDVSNPELYDEAIIFQEAATSSYLFMAPRQQVVSHSGNSEVNFQVTAVNVALWAADLTSIPDWITVNASDQNTLSLNVAENLLLEIRTALIRIFDTGNPGVNDSIYVYQYSSLDSYLLASPPTQLIGYAGNPNVQFQVTAVNVSGWQFDPSTVPSWITVTNSGGALLSLNIAPNQTQQTRQAAIRIFATGQPAIESFVTIYQYAGPAAYLIAAPRSKSVPHTGDSEVDFAVTMVNVSGWEFIDTAPYEDWIIFQNIGDSIMRLSVDENTLLQSREAQVVIQAIGNTAIKDTVYIYQYSALDSYLLASPREIILTYLGASIEFHVQSVNVDNWLIDTNLLPSWIASGNNVHDTLRLTVDLNNSSSARAANVFIFDETNPAVRDSVAVFQHASAGSQILAAPRVRNVPHYGSDSVDFQITLVNVESWEFTDTTVYQDWIDFYNIGDSIMRLSVDSNSSLATRTANIVIQSVSDPLVQDSVIIYQYSAFDKYIIVDPREQMASHSSSDTLVFNVLTVNVPLPDFEIIYVSDPTMINIEASSLTETQLSIIVTQNVDPQPRQARIRVFDTEHPNISDTVFIYQDFPYMIIRPPAMNDIHWTGEIITLYTYSNLTEYFVSKGHGLDWYDLSTDAVSWSNDPIMLSGNDSLYLRVQENNNAYLRRSSYLMFQSGSSFENQFWFEQNTRPGAFFNLSGRVLIQGDEFQPLEGVRIAIYDMIRITNAAGVYYHDKIPENWVGTITPLIDTSLPVPYYFYPPAIEITGEGITSDTILGAFAAYTIQPSVVINPKITSSCAGQALVPGSADYPAISINYTYGPSTYSWTSIPTDTLLALNPNVLYPHFGPQSTTVYTLEVTNYFRTATDTFTIVVNNLPGMVDFEGPLNVCSKQGGVVYQVIDPPPGLHYSWKLDAENPGGFFANSFNLYAVAGNIAIVNWGENPGNYTLQLFASNEFGCTPVPVSKMIEITASVASPTTTVLRKSNDNMLYATDTLAESYQWGWFTKNEAGELREEFLIPGKNEWYCRLPDGHLFDPLRYYYFVITYFDEVLCGTRSFYNAPVGIEEIHQSQISIHPNPNNGIFTLILNDVAQLQNGVIEVYNAMGQKVYDKAIDWVRKEQIINLNETGFTSPGIHLVVLHSAGLIFRSKIIVQ
ncbi:MAG: T9SS type A sorting domain-containing protein [Bacteroidales bacterium]|nr:T9SS type A sorting domain-containing protein [Bacteroidales bacterium]